MEIKTALDKLYSLHNYGIKLGLERINDLLEYLGNPQSEFKSIHIAGSNGKGSTASFAASMLMEAGYKTGLYTSPHLVKFNERVRINDSLIPDEYIAGFMEELDEYIEEHRPTFFELTTALAFKYFAENKVDYAVIETGLGGRLDATNTLVPEASVITSVSLEHENVLGSIIEKTAWEKGGIIKSGVPVFTGEMDKRAENVLKILCRKKSCEIFGIKELLTDNGNYLVINTCGRYLKLYKTPLYGRYQLYNAAIAAAAVSKIVPEINEKLLLKGIDNVLVNTEMRGRFEFLFKNPDVIFDAAHNPEAINAFLKEFDTRYTEYKKRTVIYGAMKDKNIEAILKTLGKHFDEILFTGMNYDRGASAAELEQIARRNGLTFRFISKPAEFITEFVQNRRQEVLVVTGSIYLLGEIMTELFVKKGLDNFN